MTRKYNTHHIRDDYSYYVEQAADLFGVDVATIRRWMHQKDGLQPIAHTRPTLIHSSSLKAYIEKKKLERKKPCLDHEAFCLRCQEPRTPKVGSGSVVELPNKSVRLCAACSQCGCKLNKSIKAHEWHENHPLYACLSDALREHNGVQSTHRKCSFHEETQS